MMDTIQCKMQHNLQNKTKLVSLHSTQMGRRTKTHAKTQFRNISTEGKKPYCKTKSRKL